MSSCYRNPSIFEGLADQLFPNLSLRSSWCDKSRLTRQYVRKQLHALCAHQLLAEVAKKRGVRFGRPRKLALDQGDLARRLVSEGKSVREIAAVFNVHPATIYRLSAT